MTATLLPLYCAIPPFGDTAFLYLLNRAAGEACLFGCILVLKTRSVFAWLHLPLTSPDVSTFPALADRSANASAFSRLAQHSLALRPVYSPSHLATLCPGDSSHFVTSHDCFNWFRLERKLPGGARTNWKTPPLHGAHPSRSFTTHSRLCARRFHRFHP